jgi:hypothetical protein
MSEHTYPDNYTRGRDPVMDEIWEWLDAITPGVIPDDVRFFLAGCWRGHVIRHKALARRQVLDWFEERAPQLAQVYRDHEDVADAGRGGES